MGAHPALTAEEAKALAEWTQRQAELAAAKGGAGAEEGVGPAGRGAL